MRELVSINGEIFAPDQAKISVFDRGFLYGDGVYEVVRSYGRVLFALEDHTDRLFNSAARIGIEIGLTKAALMDEMKRVYQASDRDDAYVRIVITRGEGAISLDPAAASKPNIVIIVKDIPKPVPGFYENGMSVVTASIQRNSKKALDPNIKSGNYLNNILALAEAKKRKAFDAVMINKDGFVVEGTTWNIFMVSDSKVLTPPDEAEILHGITRKILKKLCEKNKIPWIEKFFTSEELKNSQEVFATGSVREIMPITVIDDQKVGDGKPGPLTKKLATLYKEYVKEYCASH